MRIFLPISPNFSLFFIIFLFLLIFLSMPLLADDEKVEEKKAELAEVKLKIANLQEEMRERQSILEKEDTVLKEVDLRINEINNKLRNLDSRKQDINKELSDLNEKKSSTAASLKSEQLILAQQIRSAYISGHEEYIKLIMNQQDPAEVSRMLVYYRYLTESRVRTIKKINQHLELLSTLESSIGRRSAELKNLIDLGESRKLLEAPITGRQYDKKPPNLAQTLSFLSRNLAQTLSFVRPQIKKRGGSGGQRPPDIVPGTAEGAEGARAEEGAAGARGETVFSCAGEALPGSRVCISRLRNLTSSLRICYQ